jgi:tetratricopeptide (TPR) repeat protein
MRRSLILALVLLMSVSFASAYGQDYKGKGRVVGNVFDEEGNPIEGVKVKLFSQLAQSGFEVYTDAEGKWIAAWIRGGQWTMDFTKVGYLPEQVVAEFKQYARNPELEVTLKKAEGLLLTEELKDALKEGNLLFDQGQFSEAILSYEKILTDYPDAYIINKNVGNAYFQMEDYDKAIEYYQKVIAQDAANQDAMLLIGNSYFNKGEEETALEWYARMEFEKISDPNVLYNIGTNYYNLGKYDEALKYYKRSVEIKEDFIDGLYQLGLAYLTTTKYKESIEAFEKYLKYDTESGRADQVKNFIEFLKTKIG